MRLPIKSLFLCASTLFAPLVFCADITISIVKVGDGLDVRLSPETLDMGCATPDKKKTMSLLVRNSSGEDIRVGSWRSPCVCLKFGGIIDELPSDAEKEVSVTLEGENYRGEFLKHMFIPMADKTGRLKKDFFLPIKFAVKDGETHAAQIPDAPQFDRRVRFLDYDGGGFEKHNGATAWIFAGKACPDCDILKRDILPKLLDAEAMDKAEIVLVDIDKKENFMLMVEFEERFGEKGDKTPVLLWKDRLLHGNKKIRELIEGRQ